MLGKTISHYKIIAKLGEGGMGVVYKAEDTKLERLVALKFLPSSIMASETEKTRFVHEAQAAAALDHPHICTIYEIDEIEGQAFIARKFIEWQTSFYSFGGCHPARTQLRRTSTATSLLS
jgi:serine/threonine protein kinase